MVWFQKIISWYFSKNALPYWCILVVDLMSIVVAAYLSLYIFKGGGALFPIFWKIGIYAALSWPAFLIGMRWFHTYSGIIRFSSFVDLMRVSCAILVGGSITWIVSEVLETFGYLPEPATYVYRLKFWSLTLLLAMLAQWSLRIMCKYLFDTSYKSASAQRVFIYGVKNGGISLAKSMRNEHPLRYLVKGFVSEDRHYVGRYLVGTSVYAADEKLVETMIDMHIRAIFVSPLVSESFRNNEQLVNGIMKAGIKIMMMSSAESWDGKGKLSHQQLHEVDIEDLLPRDKIQVDMDAIGQMLHGKRILITGAAGSIGSEMVRQVAKYAPSELLLVDQAETPMHDVRLFMARNYPELACHTIVTSICNEEHMEELFRDHKPEYVFHAAAYKHVPMMEDNPAIAIQNNVFGTRVIADLAVKYGTHKFVMISTDKAVNPTNVMGCSKRICEIYCQALNKAIQDGNLPHLNNKTTEQQNNVKPITQFITTRFGNVLGSNGSVIPIFKEQIRKGGPVTVTHPDIIRFFMLIPEACQLVLEAGTMGKGGEIFVFDMGKPVRIADLAQRMIDLSGAKDIEIKFTGLRDGEKLYEEVLNEAETTKPTVHPKIKVASVREYSYELARQNEIDLFKLSKTFNDMDIVRKMKEIVPEYKSQHSKYQALDS